MSTPLIIALVAVVMVAVALIARGSGGPRVTTIERREETREDHER